MASPLIAYENLVELAEAQCAHVSAARLDEVERGQEEFARRLAELHGPAPEGAEPLLRRAFVLHEQATAALQKHRAELADELAGVRHGRRAAAGYAAPIEHPVGGAVDHAA